MPRFHRRRAKHLIGEMPAGNLLSTPNGTAEHADHDSHVVTARSSWGYHISIKIMLVVLCCAMLMTAFCGVFLLIMGGEFGLLTMNRTDFRHSLYEQVAWNQLASRYHFYDGLSNLRELNDTTIREFSQQMSSRAPTDLYLRVCCGEDGRIIYDNIPTDTMDWYGTDTLSIHYFAPDGKQEVHREYDVTLAVPEVKTAGSLYATVASAADTLHSLRWIILLITAAASVLTIATFALAMLVSGRQPDGTVRQNTVDRLPYDLFLALYGLLGLGEGLLIYTFVYADFISALIALIGAFALLDMPLLVLLFMSTSTRCKCGTILKNTLIWRLLCLIGKFFVLLWRYPICGTARLIASIARAVPVIWQGLLLMAAVSISTLVVALLYLNYFDAALLIIWVIAHILLVPICLYLLMSTRKLSEGARRLAQGDLGFRIDEKYLFGPLLRHAEDLNDIRLGINRAVEERMRSERFRTELITNVSHDIKTPLTSIINYIDLLEKELEETEVNETTLQYIEVIERQSLRLKKLITDLIEASKASTGALQISLAPCQVSVLLSQALAEYSDKLEAAKLEAVTRLPEDEPTIMADGRLLWRVFDNLLSNAAKYSLRGTRLYIDADTTLLQREGGSRPYLRIMFRNISGQPLNISPEELMERFVRGDTSRHTEGSGLGLSIARSLLELHHGTLELEIDGDLFKATVLLPLG